MDRILLLSQLTEHVIDEIDLKKRYAEAKEQAKIEAWKKDQTDPKAWSHCYWDFLQWDAHIPTKASITNSLRLIRKITLEIEKEIHKNGKN